MSGNDHEHLHNTLNIHTYMYAYTHTYIHKYTYIHTYIHTYMCLRPCAELLVLWAYHAGEDEGSVVGKGRSSTETTVEGSSTTEVTVTSAGLVQRCAAHLVHTDQL